MNLDDARLLLGALTRRWRRRRGLARLLWAATFLIPCLVILKASGLASTLLLGGVAALVGVLAVLWTPKLTSEQLARHLDRVLPELQDSSGLLLLQRPLNLLEGLQRRRVLDALAGVDLHRRLPWNGVAPSVRGLALSSLVSVLLWIWVPVLTSDAGQHPVRAVETPGAAGQVQEEGPLRGLRITIEPPSYTARPAREASELDLEVEEGAQITWTVEVAPEVDQARLVFDDRILTLGSGDEATFLAQQRVDRPRLYHLLLEAGGVEVYRSPFARLEVIVDAPPTVDIVRPEPFTEVDPEQPGHLTIEAQARDDYGLGEAALRATLVAGSGEMVRFREDRLALATRRASGDGAVLLTRTLDLAALGMEPGTELYFYVEVFDHRRPERNRSRTSAYRVRAPGSRGLSVDLGDGIPMLTLPDYFRSQRQIIIDTEQLLANRDQLTDREFKERGQELGFDQGALRLRYGALLGLEREGEMAVLDDDHDHDHGPEKPEGADPLDEERQFESAAVAEAMQEVPEALYHAHDSSDISTFFTSEVKTFLKAALREMWESEGHLRLFEPDQALPYENRALELIKRAQQTERVYVQRIGFDAPVVKPDEKRLTGELDKIKSQRHRFEAIPDDSEPEARRALELVGRWRRQGSLRSAGGLDEGDIAVLEAVSRVLARRAAIEVGFDLAALDLLRGWIETGRITSAELAPVEQALWRLLPEPEIRPSRELEPSGSLFEQYSNALYRKYQYHFSNDERKLEEDGAR